MKEEKYFSVSGKTRLYNANYMNDPEEGIVIEQILGLDRRDVFGTKLMVFNEFYKQNR